MKPNFSEMSLGELKRYIIAHKNDDEAFQELVSRRNPSATTYPSPLTEEGMRIMEDIFRAKFGEPPVQRDEKMKPNFSEMSLAELRAYVIANRTDDEAIHELFVNRRNPNATTYPSPLTEEGMRIMEDVFRAKFGEPPVQQDEE